MERAKKYQYYYMVWAIPQKVVQKVMETFSPFDDANYASGNYYLDEAELKALLKAEREAEKKLRNRKDSDKSYHRKKAKANETVRKRPAPAGRSKTPA